MAGTFGNSFEDNVMVSEVRTLSSDPPTIEKQCFFV